MTTNPDPRIAAALDGRGFLDGISKWTDAQWDSAIEYARESDDTSELDWMLAEDDRIQAELDDENRRLGNNRADYLYETARTAESYIPAGGGA